MTKPHNCEHCLWWIRNGRTDSGYCHATPPTLLRDKTRWCRLWDEKLERPTGNDRSCRTCGGFYMTGIECHCRSIEGDKNFAVNFLKPGMCDAWHWIHSDTWPYALHKKQEDKECS